MAQLRICLAQVDTCVGDLTGNAALVRTRVAEAAAGGAHLVAFPEMTLTGYPPEDLVFRDSFADASVKALDRLAVDLSADGHGEVTVIVGYLVHDEGPRNASALLHDGRVVATYYKHHLPNYGVFDENRYFEQGRRFPVVRVHGVDVGMTICEDLWVEGGPFAVAAAAGADLVVCINGSPYEQNKDDKRLPLTRRRAAEAQATVAYVNLVGAQDELVYDGDSLIVLADGTLVARAPQFVEHLLYADLDFAAPDDRHSADPGDVVATSELPMTVESFVLQDEPVAAYERMVALLVEPLPDEEEVWRALVLGLRDYVVKNGFSSVLLGMSGGIDSAIVASIAADAIGATNVHGISMPSRYSSDHSRSDAADSAERIGMPFETIAIGPMFDAYLSQITITGLAEENLQSRLRGMLLMGLSNQHGHLVLATGNKSELAVGYSTIYGDAVGGFAPIKDVLKTLVRRLAIWRNEYAEKVGATPPIPPNSISKPPSAELRPDQRDSDSLPDYDVLDAILFDYVDTGFGWEDLIAAHPDQELVARVVTLVDRAEYKRRQFPPGSKISFRAFGRDRRLPITSRWREGSA